MARPQTFPIYTQMRNARTCPEQIAALRSLKNDITGHMQKKERWVEHGILEHIVRIAADSRSVSIPTSDWTDRDDQQTKKLSDQEQARLHTLQLLSIFARGGPSFLKPLHEAGAIPVILANIFTVDTSEQVVLAALRALHSIAEATSLATQSASSLSALADLVFTPLSLGAFHLILTSGDGTRSRTEQQNLVAALIGRLCRDDKHQNALASYGILDDLANLLAMFVVARGELVPGAGDAGSSHGMDELIPGPAPSEAKLAVLLEAIAAIVGESRFRACLLVCSPAIMAVFPHVAFCPSTKAPGAAREAMELANFSSSRNGRLGAMDYLLPVVPVSQQNSLPTQFPSLGFSVSRQPSTMNGNGNSRPAAKFSFWDVGRQGHPSSNTELEPDNAESPFIPWLIHLVRSTDGLERVMAASVLACLFKAGFANPERETIIGCSIVPPLCNLVRESYEEITGTSSITTDSPSALAWAVLDLAPAVLARLVAGSELLQKAAYDNGAIERAGKLLVESYTTSTEQAPPKPWSPNAIVTSDEAASRLGEPGLPPLKAHRLRLRESALKLIAALIPFKEDYRKAFAEQDAVGYVIESLKVCPSKPQMNKEPTNPEKGVEETCVLDGESPYGNNPNSVIIAACHVIRILSRSVSVLRTSLSDYGVGQPLFRLLRHPDTEVQIAACGAICNLVVEVSPSRKHLIELNIVKVLCEHAHSHDARLRLEAMWALKHLVSETDNSLRKQCVEELEPGWLVQLICNDTEDDALFARRSRGKEMRDDGDESMEVETRREYGIEEEKAWVWQALYRTRSTGSGFPQRSQSPRVLKAETELQALRETEMDPVRKARNDDLAVQEQALGFIRNLVGNPVTKSTSEEMADDQTEMVDYLFSVLGQDRFFDILTSKLKTRVLRPFERRHSGRDSRVVHPQARVIENVVCILVHIAASIPRHRQLVIAQTELLKQIGQHFSSKDGAVRTALCHLLNNLMWREDQSDQEACQQRKAELKRLGFEVKLQSLESSDAELNVRERAREAVYHLKT